MKIDLNYQTYKIQSYPESFGRHWDQKKYDNFRSKFDSYNDWINDAYLEEDRNESIIKWRKVFGDDFAKKEVAEKATTSVSIVAKNYSQNLDLVSVVQQFGKNVLQQMPFRLPHVKSLSYRKEKTNIPVILLAWERRGRLVQNPRVLCSGDKIEKNSGILFKAIQKNRLPFSKTTHKVIWQVVNTDTEAAVAEALRGDFYESDKDHERYEETKFRGVHWVQAFLINIRTEVAQGQSERFFVLIN